MAFFSKSLRNGTKKHDFIEGLTEWTSVGGIYMVGRIYHVGLTVSDLNRSIAFYRDVLGLKFQGEVFMEGEETDKMFRKENCKARVAYLNGSKVLEAPPIELLSLIHILPVLLLPCCFVERHIRQIHRG